MDFEVSSVSLDRIETADLTFSITTPDDKIDLVPSISAIGLLQPPAVVKRGYGYRVICGFRRIEALAAAAISDIPVRILPEDISDMACARIAIADNSFQRQLNIVEQARAFALIRKLSDHSLSWATIARSTGLPDSREAMDRIMPVADMPISLQEGLLKGTIALPTALQISEMGKDDAMALGNLFCQITTGLNVQRELLALIGDIAKRDDIPVAKLIKDKAISAIMDNADTSTPQKVQLLRLMLKARRYPELSKAEAAYHKQLKSLKLNHRVQLQPPRFFEGTAYRLTLTVDSRAQLKSLQPELDKLIRHPDLLPE